ncbi:hypothetical protein LEP1GSC150_0617 [Leptospira interrogans serovar Copenhageni str. LT2050]|uniref:Uncharacterized protein n=1 Tax=Leptospira interrogans serovar Copenhageni str. LT2050 TaxID=1001598 RepID=M3GDX0_LEPIT|nr:hypothetical protein LEP1GSC150_0617 [Leptospira interrogans serovar Copenhageni str. LT2050]
MPGLLEEQEMNRLFRSLGRHLGWNQNQIRQEIKTVKDRYKIY